MDACKGYFRPAFLLSVFAIGLASCGGNRDDAAGGQRQQEPVTTNGDVVTAMLEAMGGEAQLVAVDNMVLHGEGTRTHFGQLPETGGVDAPGDITVTEIIDFANGQAAFDNTVQTGGGFAQERLEVLTHYKGELMGWGTTNGRPNHVTSVDGIFSWASHNSPEWLLRRNAITMALAGRNAELESAAPASVVDGSLVWAVPTTLGEEDVTLYIDQDSSLLSGWASLDTETMVGDTQAVYSLDDYREVDGLMLPFSLLVGKEDGIFLDLTYGRIELNAADMSLFEIPEDVVEEAEQVLAADGSWVGLEWNEVADGVTSIRAFSHHSMVVEFPEYVVVVEGPYTQGQSLTLARMIEENIGKPIRYVVPTHPHYDHTGGVRGLAATGANVLVAAGHEDELRMIVESPHTNPPDLLEERRTQGAEVGQVEVFSGMTEISESDMSLQLFEVTTIPHVNPMVLVYVPEAKVLFQSDLFFGGPSPGAQALYDAVTALELDVETIVGGHDPAVQPFSNLAAAGGDE